MGAVATAVVIAGIALNVAWFAHRGVGPLQLVAISGPLWLAAAGAVAAIAGGGWLLGRVLTSRVPSDEEPHR